MEIRHAQPSDEARILALVAASQLPITGVLEHVADYRVADQDGEVLGVAGLEIHGSVALLRSLAVDERARGLGVAAALCRALLDDARCRGIQVIYLRTREAEAYFRRFGFNRVCRKLVDARALVSAEFRGVVAPRTITMKLPLVPHPTEPSQAVRCGNQPCPCPDQQ